MPVLKTGVAKATVGSNPTLSAKKMSSPKVGFDARTISLPNGRLMVLFSEGELIVPSQGFKEWALFSLQEFNVRTSKDQEMVSLSSLP